MPSPYIQLLLVNMLLAFLTVIIVLGGPTFPAIVGVLCGGAVLYAGDRRRRRRAAASSAPRIEKTLQAETRSADPLRVH